MTALPLVEELAFVYYSRPRSFLRNLFMTETSAFVCVCVCVCVRANVFIRKVNRADFFELIQVKISEIKI